MRTRIISGLTGATVLLVVLFSPYTVLFTIALAWAASLAVYEMLHNTAILKNRSLLITSLAFAALEVFSCAYLDKLIGYSLYWGLLPLFWLLLFGLITWLQALKKPAGSRKVELWSFLLALYVTVGFATLASIRRMDSGIAYVLLALGIPWLSDAGAYFTGVFFGKHKMAPVISPKKTWEGFFGGIVVSALSCMLLMFILEMALPSVSFHLPLWGYGLLALVLAPVSVAGDLFASAIKRHQGIKDYGNFLPGHGGMMDRCDSVIIIAPLLYAVLLMVI